jgi:Tfp pilus assembly protein PilX
MRNRIFLNQNIARSEEGFAIPIAIGMGLVMILIATTAVVRSSNDRIASINKKSSAQSLVAAETGVSQVQDFLNRNRAAARVPACIATVSPYGTCTDASSDASWKNPSAITNLCSTYSLTNDANLVDDNNWKNVVTGDDSKGQFRIVSYDTSGVLTVEGRVNGGDSGEALSKLEAKLPVSDAGQELIASLWVTGTISGSPQISSDAVGSCASSNTVSFPSGTNYKSIKTSQAMPAAKTKPTGTAVCTSSPSNCYYTLASISGIPGTPPTLPRTTAAGYATNDVPDSDGVYKYIVTGTAANPFDGALNITSGAKVWLWVKGDIDLSDKVILNPCGNNTACGPFDVRIYPETPSTTQTLTLNKGTAVCDIFFHLPDYNVTYNNTGTVSTQDCGVLATTKDPTVAGVPENTGIYWVKSWNGGISGKTLIDAPRAYWSQSLGSTVTGLTVPALTPQIGPPSQWKTLSN